MSVTTQYVERIWLGISPSGERHQVVLRISAPILQLRGEWVSTVSLGVLDPRSDDVAGMDSWQAMQQSMQHVAKRVQAFERQGWHFFFWDAQHDSASHADPLHST
jgi:hypothetical protein